MSHLKDLKNFLNKLEEAGQNPTPIRRLPEAVGEHSAVAFRINEGTVKWDDSKKKWVIDKNFV
mgnify:CR=1 FL=1